MVEESVEEKAGLAVAPPVSGSSEASCFNEMQVLPGLRSLFKFTKEATEALDPGMQEVRVTLIKFSEKGHTEQGRRQMNQSAHILAQSNFQDEAMKGWRGGRILSRNRPNSIQGMQIGECPSISSQRRDAEDPPKHSEKRS